MANLLLIKEIAKEKKIAWKTLSERTGMSEDGLYKIVTKNVTRTNVLELIAEILEVPISIFFMDKNLPVSELLKMVEKEPQEISAQRAEIEHLKVVNTEKERTIQILQEELKFVKSVYQKQMQ